MEENFIWKPLHITVNNENKKLSMILTYFRVRAQYSEQYNDYRVMIEPTVSRGVVAEIAYKNLTYTGRVCSHKKWWIDITCDDRKRTLVFVGSHGIKMIDDYNSATLNMSENASLVQNENNEQTDEESIEGRLFKKATECNADLYNLIEDKEEFCEQLKYEIDWIVEDEENEFGVDLTSDYGIEMACKKLRVFFQCFIDSEKDCVGLVNKITVEAILERFPELNLINVNDIEEIIEECISDEYIEKSIFYEQNIGKMMDGIYERVQNYVESRRKAQFEAKYTNTKNLRRLLKGKLSELKNEQILFQNIIVDIRFGKITDVDQIFAFIDQNLPRCLEFEKLSEMLENSDFKYCLDLTKEKVGRFIEYGKGGDVQQADVDDYEIYKAIEPHYYSILYNKSRKKMKPTFDKIPQAVEYFQKIIDVMVNNEVIFEENNKFVYNLEGDFSECKKQIIKIVG